MTIWILFYFIFLLCLAYKIIFCVAASEFYLTTKTLEDFLLLP